MSRQLVNSGQPGQGWATRADPQERKIDIATIVGARALAVGIAARVRRRAPVWWTATLFVPHVMILLADESLQSYSIHGL